MFSNESRRLEKNRLDWVGKSHAKPRFAAAFLYAVSYPLCRVGVDTISRYAATYMGSGVIEVQGRGITAAGAVSRVRAGLARDPLSAIALVHALIADAQAARASDIHIDPGEKESVIRYRIDGQLLEAARISLVLHAQAIARIKILAALRTDEHQAAQDGRFRVEEGGVQIDVRVSIVPAYRGENAVLRLLINSDDMHSLEDLGFAPLHARLIARAIERPHGMLLVTGPTGSGKTTTLYTLVRALNAPNLSLLTIEDPVEYTIDGINQIQVNPRTGLSFAHGLRSMLRQDPDIIMVGEIRDTETAGLAVNTALTGHLVLSTLHTNDAPTALPRLLDMKVEPYLIASTVNIVIAQRLVRRICASCKTDYALSPAERNALRERCIDAPERLCRGVGCVVCGGSGYRGRVGIHEVLEISPDVRELILRKASASAIRAQAVACGMTSMLHDGLQKAVQRLTTIEEVLRMQYE